MNTLRALILASLLAALLPPTAQAVDDGRGKDWRLVGQTLTIASFEPIAAQCPLDGASTCTGQLGAIVLKDWVWATAPQVQQLFGDYAPAMLNLAVPGGVGGAEYFAAASLFQGRFGFTQQFQGCPTYQPCLNTRWLTGMTASPSDASTPVLPLGAKVTLDLEWGGGYFDIHTPMNPGLSRGLWMWRPTGLGTDKVYANDDLVAQAPAGGGVVLAGVLGNDWVAGAAASLANGQLTQLSSSIAGLWLESAPKPAASRQAPRGG